MLSVHARLPKEFQAAPDPTELITLWRGDKAGRLTTGMLCKLDDQAKAIEMVQEAIEGGVEGINNLIDYHTDGGRLDTPLISVTTAIQRAQHYSSKPGETIYKLVIPADRLIRDPYNIGSPGMGNHTELFVPVAIQPTDIVAFKTNNDERDASELLEERLIPGHPQPTRFILNPLLAPSDFRYDSTRQPNPAGNWAHS